MTHSRFGVEKKKMAAKNQDGVRKFLILLTRKLESGLRNSHAKIGAWFHSVTGQTITDCTANRCATPQSTIYSDYHIQTKKNEKYKELSVLIILRWSNLIQKFFFHHMCPQLYNTHV